METICTLTHRATQPRDDQDEWMVSIDGFLTKYHKGIGLRDGHKLPYYPTIWDMEQFNDPKRSRTVDPTEKEILSALALDASTVSEYPDIDDFVAEFCSGQTHSQAQEVYDACLRALTFFSHRGLNFNDYLEE